MSEISTIAAKRQAEAREVNGRFGAQFNSVPEATLLTEEEIDAAADAFLAREAQAQERQMWQEVSDTCESASKLYSRRFGTTDHQETIHQTALVDIWGQWTRGTKHVNDDAFKMYTTRAVASRFIDPNAHHTDMKARRVFKAQVDDMMQAEGRELTFKERQEIADDIRMSYPAGRRPTENFWVKSEDASLDATLGTDSDMTLADVLVDKSLKSDFATATTKAAEAFDNLEDEDSSFEAADARRNVWNILAEDHDAPKVAVKSLVEDRDFRDAVAAQGGAAATARAWEFGDIDEDDPAVTALFAPFGNLDQKQREKVTGILTSNPDFAEHIWDAAMSSAVDVTKRRVARRREARAAARIGEAA